MDGTSKTVKTNKGVASAPSKARGTVTENKDNANKDYPIHHGDSGDNKETDLYSADARQFITCLLYTSYGVCTNPKRPKEGKNKGSF